MTIAISEILQQAELLSPAEKVELAAIIAEQARLEFEAIQHNGNQFESEPASSAAVKAGAEEEDANWIDTLDLKLMPWKEVTTARVRVQEAGRLQPLPYDFSDYFDDEEEGE